jgi:hypothetical protein
MLHARPALAALLLAVLTACADDPVAPDAASFAGDPSFVLNQLELVTVDAGGAVATFWPYTGRTPNLGDAADPVTLALVGDVDPRVLRARLLMLAGDRPGFPAVPGADCTWQDAIGDIQSVYSPGTGWVPSAIQLACGDFWPMRFHARFFRLPGMTVANAHWDLYLEGTDRHQVVSWEFATQLLAYDLMRIGAAPIGQTDVITQTPTFRSVNELAPLWTTAFPAELKGLLLATGSTDGGGNLLNDGRATIFSVPAVPAEGGTGIFRQEVPLAMDVVMPRPFCAEDGQDYLYVNGTILLEQQVVMTPAGNFLSRFHARGTLDLTQIDPQTGLPLSEPYRARVNQHSIIHMTDHLSRSIEFVVQQEVRPGRADRGEVTVRTSISPSGAGTVDASISCRP